MNMGMIIKFSGMGAWNYGKAEDSPKFFIVSGKRLSGLFDTPEESSRFYFFQAIFGNCSINVNVIRQLFV
jgi:hypothetical protein